MTLVKEKSGDCNTVSVVVYKRLKQKEIGLNVRRVFGHLEFWALWEYGVLSKGKKVLEH